MSKYSYLKYIFIPFQELESVLTVHGVPHPPQSESYKTVTEMSKITLNQNYEDKSPSVADGSISLPSATPPTSPSSGGSMSSPFREYEDLIGDDDDGPVTANDPLLCGHQESIFSDLILV